jgi:hypothetical protein
MERTLLKEITKANVEAYVNRAREQFLQRMFWNKFFPLKYTTQLTWESLSGSGGNPVMADVVEYNASAPLKTRRTVSKKTGDIPKIAIKRQMDEKDMNEYNVMKALAQADANKNAILDLVFNDIDFCYTGVMARTEFLAMQALSYGSLSLDKNNNNGIITETTVDFGIPTANKTAVGTIWATAATATPVKDIETVVDNAKQAGYSIGYIVMDRATLRLMLATTEVKDKYAVFQRIQTSRKTDPTFDELNAMLEAYMLPKIVVVDSTVRFENKAHSLSSINVWKTGYVTFIPDMVIGNVMHGPIAEEASAEVKKKATLVKRDHILLTKWSELEPFGEFTKGQANAFPRFHDVDGLFILKTNGTSWA